MVFTQMASSHKCVILRPLTDTINSIHRYIYIHTCNTYEQRNNDGYRVPDNGLGQ